MTSIASSCCNLELKLASLSHQGSLYIHFQGKINLTCLRCLFWELLQVRSLERRQQQRLSSLLLFFEWNLSSCNWDRNQTIKKKKKFLEAMEERRRGGSNVILPEGKICVVKCTEFFSELIYMNISRGNVICYAFKCRYFPECYLHIHKLYIPIILWIEKQK